jgi:hypothetical protein
MEIRNKLSDGFPVTKGHRQGCCISPTLFNIYLEQALGLWRRKCRSMGIPIGDNTIYMLHFADDQLIIAQDLDDIEYLKRKLVEEYKKWRLEINLNKTHYMCVGQQQSDLLLEGGELIKQWTEAGIIKNCDE